MAGDGMDKNSPISLTLGDTLRDFVDAQVAGGGYNDVSDYLYHLVREEQKRVVRGNVVALLKAGAASPLRERAEADWELLRAEISGLSSPSAPGRETL